MPAVQSLACNASELLARVADEFSQAIERGESLEIEVYCERYPQIAPILRDVLPALALLKPEPFDSDLTEDSAGALPAAYGEPPIDRTLGDFRLKREIGRGGMGVVYEAEQISLGRTVALKVLPFASMLDQRQLARFHNEARAAAALHHNNIVPVFSVGSERGVHYYAMQFIPGESLAAILDTMRREPPHSPTVPVGFSSAETQALAHDDTLDENEPAPRVANPLASSHAANPRAYYRRVAELGIQAAEALDHAHEQGVIHRDIKPANLLLDDSGRLWIADFGLARLETDAGMTMTGDLLGTLRYMSPEQALAKRVVVDHQTDIYSLGVTLYELFALRPAFEEDDRHALLRQIAFEDPPLLCKVIRQIPAELETIIEKSIRKNPAERYATAKDLADDLRRFLANQPIKAKQPTWREQAAKWSRRHPAGLRATLAAGLFMLFVVAASLGWIARDRATRQAIVNKREQEAIDDTQMLYQAGNLRDAVSAIKRASAEIADGASEPLRHTVEQWQANLELAERLEQIRIQQAVPSLKVVSTEASDVDDAPIHSDAIIESPDKVWDREGARQAYESEFQKIGIDFDRVDVAKASLLIQSSPIKRELIAAIDDWYQLLSLDNKSSPRQPTKEVLFQIAQLSDSDAFRHQLRDTVQNGDKTALLELAKNVDLKMESVPTVLALSRAVPNSAVGVGMLRRFQQIHPSDFWVNFELADMLPDDQMADEIAFRRVTVALRPDSAGALLSLGVRLYEQKQYAEAETAFKQVVQHNINYAPAYRNLSVALSKQGKDSEAEASIRKAVEIDANDPRNFHVLGDILHKVHKNAAAEAAYRESLRLGSTNYWTLNNLAWTLHDEKKIAESIEVAGEAVVAGREAARRNPKDSEIQRTLGNNFRTIGKYAESEAAYREALRLDPNNSRARLSLVDFLQKQNKYAEAVTPLRDAIRLKPNNIEYYNYLRTTLEKQGKIVEAIEVARDGIRLNPKDPAFQIALGDSLEKDGKFAEAEAIFREAIRIDPGNASGYSRLGFALNNRGKFKEAEAPLREGIRLKPDDAEALEYLSWSLFAQGRYAEAREPLLEAICLKPNEARLRGALVDNLLKDGEYAKAESATREEIHLNPKDGNTHRKLGTALAKQAEAINNPALWEEAVAEFVRAIDLSADKNYQSPRVDVCRALAESEEAFDRVAKLRLEEPALWIGRGQYRALRSQWSLAAADYEMRIHSRPLMDDTDEYAFLLLLRGDVKGYQNFCNEILDRFGEPREPRAAFLMARACAAASCDAVDPARAVDWATKGAAAKGEAWCWHALGLAHYRAGQYQAAVEDTQKSNTAPWGNDSDQRKAHNWLVMAMGHHRMGHTDESRTCLQTARKMIDLARPKNPDEGPKMAPVDWIEIQVLSREAEALLGSSSDHAEAAPPSAAGG